MAHDHHNHDLGLAFAAGHLAEQQQNLTRQQTYAIERASYEQRVAILMTHYLQRGHDPHTADWLAREALKQYEPVPPPVQNQTFAGWLVLRFFGFLALLFLFSVFMTVVLPWFGINL